MDVKSDQLTSSQMTNNKNNIRASSQMPPIIEFVQTGEIKHSGNDYEEEEKMVDLSHFLIENEDNSLITEDPLKIMIKDEIKTEDFYDEDELVVKEEVIDSDIGENFYRKVSETFCGIKDELVLFSQPLDRQEQCIYLNGDESQYCIDKKHSSSSAVDAIISRKPVSSINNGSTLAAISTHIEPKSSNIRMKPFACDVCEKSFSHLGSLKRHKRIHSGESLVCDTCNKTFTHLGSLKEHMRIHTGEKQFHCDVCQKSFVTFTQLNTHKFIHTGKKHFVCDICGKSSSRPGDLKTHMRIHTGEKPFVCNVCGQSFTISCHLKVHKRTHTGERPFFCDVCEKSFSQFGNLKRHMQTHTGEKSFVCHICKKTFTQSGSLKQHMRIHTGEKPFVCDCKKLFRFSWGLTSHKRNRCLKTKS